MEENENQNQEASTTVSTNNYNQIQKPQDDVVSTWSFVGLLLLYCIPCVNIICLIIFACGGIKNQNIKNHARAMLIITLFIVILWVVLFGILGVGIFSASKSAINSSLYY